MARVRYIFLVVLMSLLGVTTAQSRWTPAHVTFYGDARGYEATKGACGYQTTWDGYGLKTTALSTALFNNGLTCGACYEIKCYNSTQWCKPGTIHVTATNFCPPSDHPTGQNWCNPPQKHFDLTMPMFLQIAQYKAGIVPVLYRRVPCHRKGGIKFQMTGNPNWLLVLVYNVAGAGDVTSLRIKGSKTGWMQMSRNWGQNWQVFTGMVRQSLSFQVTTSDGKSVICKNVAPVNWHYGGVYEAASNY